MVGLNKLVPWIKTKISNLFVKAILNADITIPVGGGIPSVNLDMLSEEVQNDVIYPLAYGLYSYPLNGAQAFVAFPNGSRDEGIVLTVTDDKYIPNNTEVSPGDLMIRYKDTHTIHLNEDGIKISVVGESPIELEGKNVNVTLSAGGQFAVNNSNFTVDA